jgi:hypothetical protein
MTYASANTVSTTEFEKTPLPKNPIKVILSWKSFDDSFEYYDKEKKEKVKIHNISIIPLALPTKISGYSNEYSAYYYSPYSFDGTYKVSINKRNENGQITTLFKESGKWGSKLSKDENCLAFKLSKDGAKFTTCLLGVALIDDIATLVEIELSGLAQSAWIKFNTSAETYIDKSGNTKNKSVIDLLNTKKINIECTKTIATTIKDGKTISVKAMGKSCYVPFFKVDMNDNLNEIERAKELFEEFDSYQIEVEKILSIEYAEPATIYSEADNNPNFDDNSSPMSLEEVEAMNNGSDLPF